MKSLDRRPPAASAPPSICFMALILYRVLRASLSLAGRLR